MVNKNFKKVLEDINSGVLKKTAQIAHVSYYMINKTPYSFHFYAVYQNDNGKDVLTELFYDLRNKEYFIARNGKEVKFNVANLDLVVPRTLDKWVQPPFHRLEDIESFFKMVSVEENEGMYDTMRIAIGSIGDERADMTSRALIRLITEYHKLELLYKAGLDIRSLNGRAFRNRVREAGVLNLRKVHEILGVTKSQYKFMVERGYSAQHIFENRKYISSLEQKHMDTYRAYLKHMKELEESYNIDGRLEEFKRNCSPLSLAAVVYNHKHGIGQSGNNFFSFIYKYNFSNPMKLLEYLFFECYNSQGLEYHTAMVNYVDYYRMCTDMKYENFDRYPKYLRTMHDIAVRNYRAVQDEVTNRKFAEAVSAYADYEMTIGDYCIVVPKKAQELVTEGNVLHHCVGSYVKNVSNGHTMIVFLRLKKEKETPLVTIEVRGDRIAQVRGQSNRQPEKEEKEAVEKFAKRKKLKLNLWKAVVV